MQLLSSPTKKQLNDPIISLQYSLKYYHNITYVLLSAMLVPAIRLGAEMSHSKEAGLALVVHHWSVSNCRRNRFLHLSDNKW